MSDFSLATAMRQTVAEILWESIRTPESLAILVGAGTLELDIAKLKDFSQKMIDAETDEVRQAITDQTHVKVSVDGTSLRLEFLAFERPEGTLGAEDEILLAAVAAGHTLDEDCAACAAELKAAEGEA